MLKSLAALALAAGIVVSARAETITIVYIDCAKSRTPALHGAHRHVPRAMRWPHPVGERRHHPFGPRHHRRIRYVCLCEVDNDESGGGVWGQAPSGAAADIGPNGHAGGSYITAAAAAFAAAGGGDASPDGSSLPTDPPGPVDPSGPVDPPGPIDPPNPPPDPPGPFRPTPQDRLRPIPLAPRRLRRPSPRHGFSSVSAQPRS